MRTASIHGKKLPLHAEEADIRTVAEGGVHQTAAPLGELRGRAYESPRTAFGAPLFISGARSHKQWRSPLFLYSFKITDSIIVYCWLFSTRSAGWAEPPVRDCEQQQKPVRDVPSGTPSRRGTQRAQEAALM